MPNLSNAPSDPAGTSRRHVVLMGAAATLAGGTLAGCGSGSSATGAATDAGAASGTTASDAPSTAADTTTPPASTTESVAPAPTSSAPVPANATTATHGSSTHATPRTTTATSGSKTSATSATRTTTTSKPPAVDYSKGALASLSDVPVGGSVQVSGVIIYRSSSSRVVGHSSVCTHQGCTVGAGGRTLQCPCHGSAFDASSGAVQAGPATRPLPGIALVVKGGYIHRA